MRPRVAAADPCALGMEMWALGLESAMVIGLRTLKLAAGGPDAGVETERMISEKMTALAELPWLLATCGNSPPALARSAVRHYARKVRANRRRLSHGVA